MAQKGGSVVTHLRIGASRDKLFATRLWENSADLVIGCDLVVTTSPATLDLVRPDSARIVVNSDVVPTAQFQANQAHRPEPGAPARRAGEARARASTSSRWPRRRRPCA